MGSGQRDSAKERFWRRAMARFRASRLNIRDFCRREFLPEPNFYAWRAELARRDRAGPRRLERAAPKARLAPAAQPGFLPVRVIGEPDSHDAIEILLPDGLVLRVRPGFDQDTLAQAEAVLEGLRC